MESRSNDTLQFEILKSTPQLEVRRFFSNTHAYETEWFVNTNEQLLQRASGIGWMLQLDKQQPFPIGSNEAYFIPAGVPYRMTKTPGASDFVVQLHKKECNLTQE